MAAKKGIGSMLEKAAMSAIQGLMNRAAKQVVNTALSKGKQAIRTVKYQRQERVLQAGNQSLGLNPGQVVTNLPDQDLSEDFFMMDWVPPALSKRAFTVCTKHDIHTVHQLAGDDPQRLIRTFGVGSSSIQTMVEALTQAGYETSNFCVQWQQIEARSHARSRR